MAPVRARRLTTHRATGDFTWAGPRARSRVAQRGKLSAGLDFRGGSIVSVRSRFILISPLNGGNNLCHTAHVVTLRALTTAYGWSDGGMLDGGPDAVDGESGGSRRQCPGGKWAVVLPGGEAGVDSEDDQLAEPQRDERRREQVVVDPLGINEGERRGRDHGDADGDDDP